MNSYQDIIKKQLKSDKKKNILMIIGIIISVALLMSYSILDVFKKDLDVEKSKKIYGNYDGVIHNLPVAELDKIKRNYIIDNIGIIHEDNEGIIKDNNDEISYNVYSLDDIAINKSYKEAINVLEGRLPSKSNEILIDTMVKSKFEKVIGDEITLGNKNYIISGFASFAQSSSEQIKGITYLEDVSRTKDIKVLFDIKEDENIIEHIKNIGTDLSYFVKIDLDSGVNEDVKDEAVIEGTYIDVNDEVVKQKEGIYDPNVKRINQLCYILICSFTVILVYAYISASVSDKIKQISTLRCIGATPKQIKILVFKESLILSSFAIIPGVIIGYILTYVVTKFILEGMMNMNFYGISISIYPFIILKTIIISYLTVLLATTKPASYASKIEPVDGIRTKGSNVKNIKIRKSKFIRKRFGLIGDIAYRNMRSSKNFVINTLVLSISMIILIVFTSYANLMIEDIKFKDTKIPSDANVLVNGPDLESELSKVNEYLSSQRGITNIRNIIEVTHPMMIEDSSINIEYKQGSYEYIEHDDSSNLYIYGEGSLPSIYVYSDESFEEIKNKIDVKNITLDKFKNEGLILVSSNNKAPINKVIGDKVNIRLNPYYEYDVHKTDEYIKNVNPMKLEVVGIIDIDDMKDPDYNHQTKNNMKFIIHESSYFKYLEGKSKEEMMGSDRGNVLFDFKSDKYRKDKYEEISDYMETIGHWYVDNNGEQEMLKNQITGVSTLVYSGMIMLVMIIYVSIYNSRNVNMLIRMKEFGMLLSVGCNKKQLRKIVILESLIQSIIASIIAVTVSYAIVSVMGKVMLSGYAIHEFEMSILPFMFGVILIVIINSTTSIRPLEKIKELSLVDMMKSEK